MNRWSGRYALVLVSLGLVAILLADGFDADANKLDDRAVAPVTVISRPAPPGTPTVRIGAATAAPPVARGFLGLSVEYSALIPYAGERGLDPVFRQLIRNLNEGQRPVLRIGGDSTDWSWIHVPGMRRPGGVNFTIRRRWLRVIGALTRALHARVIFGLNLEAGSDRLAVTEARAFAGAVGPPAIEAFEIGNEPERYGTMGWYAAPDGAPVFGRRASYDIGAYTGEYARVARAPELASAPLAGPATGSVAWIDGLDRLLRTGRRPRLVTVHRYPLSACDLSPRTPAYPTVAHLLAPVASRGLARSVAGAVALAHAAGARLRVDEINSVSCRGRPGVSDSFASSLWALDTLFSLARVGVDGVNIHTLPRSAYQPFAVTRVRGRRTWTVNPLYFGLLMFAQAAPPGARLLSVSGSAGPLTRVWATSSAGRTRLVVINDSATRTRYIRVHATGAYGPARLIQLRARSLTATTGITYGGRTFGDSTTTGRLTGTPRLTELARTAAGYVVRIPPADAALLTFSTTSVSAPSRGGTGRRRRVRR